MFGADAFRGAVSALLGLGVIIGLVIAGIIWGITKLIPHISIIWK
jgi:hypothetical protein